MDHEQDSLTSIKKPVKDMTKEELAQHVAELKTLLKTKRASPYTEGGVRAGSKEYYRRYRAAHREEFKAYQTGYRARVRMAEAVDDIVRTEDVSPEEATRLAQEKLENIALMRKEMKTEEKIQKGISDYAVEMADELCIPVVMMQRFMDEGNDWRERAEEYATQLFLARDVGIKPKGD